ncbi:hypothetical protein MPTK1_3g20470 [Marchantia polymorpha subsp. ruderalis]|uniref:Uncharacterized protein n=2 Tax=Marchantia polymorpha TaxID=3197 RepID=A0AAF6B2X6_MARPO|nr:hypothetical protein MARPO_0149s0012 [Marchantia polymorpha]BBN06360.1 hypothetical protein Mp_3g20470 [Marchantia polymorpha subsp. ruderalis]|eukprot:PTQ29015.1 hypothetical protein MARPO_0149s0012 [Marchantia polymorpha]
MLRGLCRGGYSYWYIKGQTDVKLGETVLRNVLRGSCLAQEITIAKIFSSTGSGLWHLTRRFIRVTCMSKQWHQQVLKIAKIKLGNTKW